MHNSDFDLTAWLVFGALGVWSAWLEALREALKTVKFTAALLWSEP